MALSSIWKNGLLNALRVLCSLLFPLITFPYISNILDISDVGRYEFSYSFVQYFVTLAVFGATTYGTREGAVAKAKSTEDYSKFASEVFSLNLLTCAFSIALLLACIFLIPALGEYSDFLLLFSLLIAFNVVGVEWVYTSRADYVFITVRAIAFQVIALVLMFLLVHSPGDYLLYGGITVFAAAGSSIVGLVHSRHFWHFRMPKIKAVFSHFVPMAIIFFSVVANVIYVNSSLVLLGFLSTSEDVGQYGLAMKIYRAVKSVAMAFATVSIPVMAVYFAKKDYVSLISTVSNLFKRLTLVAFPCIAGLLALSSQIVLLLSSPLYLDAVPSVEILAIAIPFCLLAYLYVQCVLIPMRKERLVLAISIFVAAFNIVANVLFIPHFGKEAAAFSIVASEFLTFAISYLCARAVIPMKGVLSCLVKSGIGAMAVYGVCSVLALNIESAPICLLVAIVASVVFYFSIELLLKNDALLEIASSVRKRMGSLV